MSAPSIRATAILAEHFGYYPVSVVDDVINAVNEILYRCTSAMETFLNDQQREKEAKEGYVADAEQEEKIAREIEAGTAQVETLFESAVDKNFDRFELYTLRNIMNVPAALVDEGYFRLSHHRDLDVSLVDKCQDDSLDEELIALQTQIAKQMETRKQLDEEIRVAGLISDALVSYKNLLSFLTASNETSSVGDSQNAEKLVEHVQNVTRKLNPEVIQALKSVAPIDESFYFLTTQLEEIVSRILTVHHSVHNSGTDDGKPLKEVVLQKSDRDVYLDQTVGRILQNLDPGVPDSGKGV